MIVLAIAVGVSYLLGSVIGSLLLGRFRGIDIRTQGSGNAGGTNALRTQGKGFAAAVIIIDIGKGVLAAWPVAAFAATQAGGEISAPALAVACGAAAVVGHVWPVFFQFRGGKGAATLVGVLAVVQPLALIPVLGAFALVLVLSGFVGLSTIIATASTIAWAVFVVDGGVASPFGAFTVAMTLFILWTHRANIQRMLAGNENRFAKVMLLRRRD
jgi:glycerol-3-phosphate acyltransferase PlsY